jgi:hypothetical protein
VRRNRRPKLRQKLDWRPFVRLRMLMAWEDESGSRRLLQEVIDHYQQYSGEYGFSDETDGAGRFDRSDRIPGRRRCVSHPARSDENARVVRDGECHTG